MASKSSSANCELQRSVPTERDANSRLFQHLRPTPPTRFPVSTLTSNPDSDVLVHMPIPRRSARSDRRPLRLRFQRFLDGIRSSSHRIDARLRGSHNNELPYSSSRPPLPQSAKSSPEAGGSARSEKRCVVGIRRPPPRHRRSSNLPILPNALRANLPDVDSKYRRRNRESNLNDGRQTPRKTLYARHRSR